MIAPTADAHLHIFRHGYPGASGRPVLGDEPEIDAYERLRVASGIEAGLIVGYTADGIDPGNNTYIRELASSRPWMHTLGYVSATADGASTVADLLNAGHSGIALYVPDAAHGDAVAGWPASVWHHLDERRAIISLNAQPEATAALSPAIRQAPNACFLFSHLGLPGRHAATPDRANVEKRLAALLGLAALANVYVKISGLYAISDPATAYPHNAAAPFVDALLQRFGARRCVWGSDFSPALEFVSFAEAVNIRWLERLSATERHGVMGGNLLGILNKGKTN